MANPGMKPGRRATTAAETSAELVEEWNQARTHPNEIFGYGRYGDGKHWTYLDKMTGGLQRRTLGVLAARPKRGKSMLAAAWVPSIAEQALMEDAVVRVVTLEMQRRSYQRRMAAILAGIPNPMDIRRGTLGKVEERRYLRSLDYIASLPIEYLSNEEDLTEEEALRFGNSPVTFDEVSRFIRAQGGKQTYWWLLDHIGLLNDLDAYGDITKSIYTLANKLGGLAHTVATGLVITHLTRASVGTVPTIESIAGSDQVGRIADQIFLLSRPFMDAGDLSEEDRALIRESEPAFLLFQSRDESSGVDVLLWKVEYATFEEMDIDEEAKKLVPVPKKKR